MGKEISLNEVIEEIYQSIRATPKKQRRLKSSTFWNKFGIERRSSERVSQVKEALSKRSIILTVKDSQFGVESRNNWITLSYLENEPPHLPDAKNESDGRPFTPSDDWFELMANRGFESEREVEYFFIVPLLEKLGYTEEDLAIGFGVLMYEGFKKINKEADIVTFDGVNHAKENALLVIEAKGNNKLINEDNVGQARSYCQYLFTPYYIVTNGEEIRVYLFRGSVQPDVLLMNFQRGELRQNWDHMYRNLNKLAVSQRKEKLKELLEANEK